MDTQQPARRRSDALDNRARILQAAHDLFTRGEPASVEDIARAAGLVRRTVYGHFASREELLLEVGQQEIAELVDALAGRPTADNPVDALADFVLMTWEHATRAGILLRLAQDSLGSRVIREALDPLTTRARAIVTAGMSTGDFADDLPPDVLVRVLQACTLALIDSADRESWEGGAQAAVATILRTAGATERAARPRTHRQPAGSTRAP